MSPFNYPNTPHTRRHGLQGYADAASYRPWLRDEFSFRCVYCLLREQWGQVRGVFAIDHFLAVASSVRGIGDYDNLLYACASCNAAKGDREAPDPLVVFTTSSVQVAEDGTIRTSNTEASRLIEILGLNSPQSTEFRMLWIGIVALAARHDLSLYHALLGYPADLPNLAVLRPPGGNTRPQGVHDSYHSRRQNGTLADTH